jgi:hypothetical protein
MLNDVTAALRPELCGGASVAVSSLVSADVGVIEDRTAAGWLLYFCAVVAAAGA